MKIAPAPLPVDVKAAIPSLLAKITEYLDLEDAGFSPRDVKYSTYFTVDDSVGFVVFDYTADDHCLPFAFVQYSLSSGLGDSACIGGWPRTEGETLAWPIAEYFTMNPIRDD
jgi:hypothetical protein